MGENKTLSNEIKDIMDQISEGGRSIHEIDKIRKRLEAEKMELQAALEEAEGALEQEENKVLRAQLELTQVSQEIERRIGEKEEEFASTRKNYGKAVDSMQTALEQESRGKAEALRMNKKPKRLSVTIYWPMSAGLIQPKMPLRRLALFLSNLIVPAGSLSKSSQTPMSNFLN